MTGDEWFEGRSVDELHQRCYTRRVGFVIFLALAAALILGPMLAGCSSAPVMSVCELKYLGKSDKGNPLFLSACESPDKFVADNK